MSFSLLSIVCNHASAQKAGDMISGVAGVKIDTVLMSIDEAIEELERIPGYGMVFDDEASFVNTKFENGYGYVDLGLSVKWAMRLKQKSLMSPIITNLLMVVAQ